MPLPVRPLVSIGIPLYKSRPFLDCILNNISALEYSPLEIIISDRHGADDAFEILREKFHADARFTFLQARDELSWPRHYNLLLQAARGEYFFWMPHDDTFPANYVPDLVQCLEANPEVVLAYGRIEAIHTDGSAAIPVFVAPPVEGCEEWSRRIALRLLTQWNLGIVFRGVFRRQAALKNQLFLRAERDTVFADVYWAFALALVGELRFVPSCYCLKRYHDASAHARWRISARHAIQAGLWLHADARRLCQNRVDERHAATTIFIWTLLRIVELKNQHQVGRAAPPPDARKPPLARYLTKLLGRLTA